MSGNAKNTPPPAEAVVVTVTEEKKDDSKVEFSAQPKNKSSPLKLRHIVLTLALVTFLLSIPLLFQAIWLMYTPPYDCEDLLKTLPRLQLGIAISLIIIFFLSNGVVYSNARFNALGLILVILPLVVMFTIGLSLGGSLNTDSGRIPGSPRWLKMEVIGNDNWENIKPCLYKSITCMEVVSRSFDPKHYDFRTNTLSSRETGCCIPPLSCEMDYVNTTYWIKGKRTADAHASSYNEDCDLWQNEDTMLCYDCHACKDGFIKTLEGKWLKIGTFLVVMSLLLMLSHIVLFVGTMLEHHTKYVWIKSFCF